MAGLKIRKGDEVIVLAGKDKGRTGRVAFAHPDEGTVVVEGVNVATKHLKSRSPQDPGGIIDKDMPIDASNVALVCPSCGKATRIGYRFEPDGSKVRICKKCEGELS